MEEMSRPAGLTAAKLRPAADQLRLCLQWVTIDKTPSEDNESAVSRNATGCPAAGMLGPTAEPCVSETHSPGIALSKSTKAMIDVGLSASAANLHGAVSRLRQLVGSATACRHPANGQLTHS